MRAQLDPRIGALNSGRFYCFPNGYGSPEFTGTLTEVETVLGLAIVAGAKSALSKDKKNQGGGVRAYIVTVTPELVVYAGARTEGEYAVEVVATSRQDAIKQARAARQEQEGRHGVRVKYKASLAE